MEEEEASSDEARSPPDEASLAPLSDGEAFAGTAEAEGVAAVAGSDAIVGSTAAIWTSWARGLKRLIC